LTTHSGSLPRPAGFLPLVLAQEAGQPVDDAQFRTEVRAAVRETVQRQADAGVDVLNDGEVSKPSYATYVKDRLTGFGGEGSIEEVAALVMGLDDFPDFAEKMAQTMASAAKTRFTSCDGPVGYIGQRAVQSDIENLKAVAEGVPAAATFMSAASPGVIAVFSPNRYYASQEEYLGALADAMRAEYQAIHRGLHTAAGLPGPGHDRAWRRLTGELPQADGTRGGGAQPRAGRYPRRSRAYSHLLGQRRNAADHRCRAQGDHRHHLEDQAGRPDADGVQRPACT
jgi:5-methyltetrahydropteroyltriglutamate--homocysteine methyltransferase